jgi:phage gp46-like protein
VLNDSTWNAQQEYDENTPFESAEKIADEAAKHIVEAQSASIITFDAMNIAIKALVEIACNIWPFSGKKENYEYEYARSS